MNVRPVVASVIGAKAPAGASRPWSHLFVTSFALVVACGPKEPPRQANIPDPPDPGSESESSGSSSSASRSDSSRSGGGDVFAPPPGGKAVAGKGGEPPQVASLAAFTEGIKWGTSHAELTKQFTQTGGVIWKDFDEKLAKARVGPEQSALEAEREQTKAAFTRSLVEFKDTPTGYDTTGIRSEYSYKNKESLMSIKRQGKTRFFFFFNDRLWKVYDEVPLADGGPLGKTYLEAVNKLNAQLNAQGRVQSPNAAHGIELTTVDWKDGASHLRAVDRSGDRLVGLAVEESSTYSNLAALRPNKPSDPNEIDPSITAVTQGTNRTDPNAVSATPSASASSKKTPPKKK